MPDDKADLPVGGDENEYGSQADAEKVERESGTRQGQGAGDAHGDEKAEAAERSSGAIKDGKDR